MLKPAVLSTVVATIVGRAAASAVQLGNFPLGSCDIQCAFDCWVQDTRPTFEEQAQVAGSIAQLGWEF